MADDAPVVTETPPVETPPPQPSWRDTLPEDIRAAPELQKYKEVADLAKGHLNQAKLIGQKFAPPGKDAKPEDIANYRKAIGVPDAPDQYVFEIPEVALEMGWDESLEKEFRQTMHDLGAPAAMVTEMIKYYGMIEQRRNDASVAEANALGAELRKQWGAMYNPRMARIQRMISDLGGQELINGFQTAGHILNKAGRHPLMLQFFAKLADDLYESGTLTGEGLAGMSSAEAETKLTALRKELKDLHEGPGTHQRRMALIDEITELTNLAKSGR